MLKSASQRHYEIIPPSCLENNRTERNFLLSSHLLLFTAFPVSVKQRWRLYHTFNYQGQPLQTHKHKVLVWQICAGLILYPRLGFRSGIQHSALRLSEVEMLTAWLQPPPRFHYERAQCVLANLFIHSIITFVSILYQNMSCGADWCAFVAPGVKVKRGQPWKHGRIWCVRQPAASLHSPSTQQQTKPFNTSLANSGRRHAARWPAHRNVSTPHIAAGRRLQIPSGRFIPRSEGTPFISRNAILSETGNKGNCYVA